MSAADILRHQAIELVPIGEVQGYDRNARTHSTEQVEKLAGAIREFGWTTPLMTDKRTVLIAGHGRLLAARKLGLIKVPVMRIRGLTPARFKAMVIADNALASFGSGWDEKLLAEELRDLEAAADAGELELAVVDLGFTDEDLKGYAEFLAPPPEKEEVREVLLGEEPHVCRAGETWALGPHRFTVGGARGNDLRAADALIIAWERQNKGGAQMSGGGLTFKARAESLGIEFKRQDMKAQKARTKEG